MLSELIKRLCVDAEFVLRQTGPASYEATFTRCVRLRAGQLANYLGGVAVMEGDTIYINGCEVELRLLARG